jgi:hypothetical protein
MVLNGEEMILIPYWLRLLAVFLLCLSIVGCIGPAPHKEMVTPEIKGKVVDAETGVPIEKVTVSLIPGESFGVAFTANIIYRDVSETVITDSEGRFFIPPSSGWYFWVHYMPGGFGAVHELLLKFDHPDYNQNTYHWVESFASYEKIPPLNTGDIKLVKRPDSHD